MKLQDSKPFLDFAKKKAILSDSVVNNWVAALNAISSVLEADEQTVEFVLNESDVIRNRLQNQSTTASGSTINLYIQRGQNALRNFLEWKEDRAAWEKKQASRPKSEAPKAKREVRNSDEGDFAQKNFGSTGKKVLPIPTADGDTFEVALPVTYRMSDLARVMWALAVYARDFDPADVLKKYGNPSTGEAREITPPQIVS